MRLTYIAQEDYRRILELLKRPLEVLKRLGEFQDREGQNRILMWLDHTYQDLNDIAESLEDVATQALLAQKQPWVTGKAYKPVYPDRYVPREDLQQALKDEEIARGDEEARAKTLQGEICDLEETVCKLRSQIHKLESGNV